LQDHGSDERRLQTVRGLVADDLAKGSEGVPVQLPVVGQPSQELLDLFRGAVSLDDSPLFAGEDVRRLGRLGHGRLFCNVRSRCLPILDAHRRRDRNQSGYSSFRQVRGSAGWAFGVRSSMKLKYGATNGSGADSVYVW